MIMNRNNKVNFDWNSEEMTVKDINRSIERVYINYVLKKLNGFINIRRL